MCVCVCVCVCVYVCVVCVCVCVHGVSVPLMKYYILYRCLMIYIGYCIYQSNQQLGTDCYAKYSHYSNTRFILVLLPHVYATTKDVPNAQSIKV